MRMSNTIKLIASSAENAQAEDQNHLKIANDAAVESQREEIAQASVIELHFPAFTDGRAFSQAMQLRKRLNFKGDIRATGDVLVDQLVQMQRSGFSSAVLREDQNLAHGQKLLAHYRAFYQGDAANLPAFAEGKLNGSTGKLA
jgi:uncharacterized protein (DUF934 family)